MSRFRLALLAVGALAVAGAAVITYRLRQVRRSPLDSLQRLADAARARDRLAIEQYLDVRRVAESVVDDAISTATALAAAEPSGSALGLTMIEGMKPSVVTLVEQSIWTALTDSPATVPDSRVPDMVGGPLDLRALSRRYEGVADVEQRERVARVGVRIRLEDVDSAMVVHFRMDRADGHWRVVGVEDLGPYLQASFERRLERAYEAAMKSALRNLVTAQGAYFADHMTYTQSLQALPYYATPDVSVEIVEANRDGGRAVARHQKANSECRIAVGTAVLPGDVERQPKCSRPSER